MRNEQSVLSLSGKTMSEPKIEVEENIDQVDAGITFHIEFD